VHEKPFISHHLRQQLNKYDVETPEFSMMSNKKERVLRFFASPTEDPFEPLIAKVKNLSMLHLFPIVSAFIFALIQLFIM